MATVNQTDSRISNVRNRNIDILKLQLRTNEYLWVIDDENFNSADIQISDSSPITIFLIGSKIDRVYKNIGIYLAPDTNHPRDKQAINSILEWGFGGAGVQIREPITTSSDWQSIKGGFGDSAVNRISLQINNGELIPSAITLVELRVQFPSVAPAIGSLRFKIKSIYEE